MVLVTLFLFTFSLTAQAEPALSKSAFLPTSFKLKGVLLNVVYSYNRKSPAEVEIETDARYCNPLKPKECGEVVFPRKTKFVGSVPVLKSNDRIDIDFHLAILPDGREIEISALALSPDGSRGIRGRVQKHKDSRVASAALKGAISGSAAVAGGFANPVAAEAAEELVNAAGQEMELSREKIDTSIEVPAFTRCQVYLKHRVELDPQDKKVDTAARVPKKEAP